MLKIARTPLLLIGGACMLAPLMSAQRANTETFFVMSNNPDSNEVIAFVHSADGSLLQETHYATHGRGSGGVNDPLESQGSLTLNADHSMLFAVNSGSGEITSFQVQNSALEFAGKVPSGGSSPVAIAQSHRRVYVLNQGGPGSVVGFQVGQEGQLSQIPRSTAFLSANAVGGSSISISPDGQTIAVVERLANNIDVFHVNPDGTLENAVVNPSPAPGAFAGLFAPDGALLVSETGPAGAVGASAISSYSIQSSGHLSVISQSVPTFGNANCWNAISPDGLHVYVSNAGSSTISGFTIGRGGVLSPISSTVLGSNPAGATNLDITVSGDGKVLYSLNAKVGAIGVFLIGSGGTLTEVAQITGFTAAVGFNGIAAL
jgi:6-phosphogluconolactonase